MMIVAKLVSGANTALLVPTTMDLSEFIAVKKFVYL